MRAGDHPLATSPERPPVLPRLLALALLAATLIGLGCRASRPDTDPATGLQVTLDIVPLILPADTAETATVWVTVTDGGSPVADSTRVSLVATLGTIGPEAYTVDGLAVAGYRAACQSGSASIIAQARGVRDTMRITLY